MRSKNQRPDGGKEAVGGREQQGAEREDKKVLQARRIVNAAPHQPAHGHSGQAGEVQRGICGKVQEGEDGSMKMETIKEAGLRHKEWIRHYQDRKSHCDEDFKAGACWLAEYLMSVPFNEILEELVELKEDIDYDKRTD